MKFLLRLLHVFIGTLIFLGLGYLIQNVDFDNSVTDTVEETVSDTTGDSSSHDKMAGDTTTSETVEHNTADSHDTAMNGNDDSEDHDDSNDLPSDGMDSDHNDDDSSMLNYEMEAIDPHSVGHITEMIEIIDVYKLEPHSDKKTLNNQLIVRNYVHFEKELSKKNEPVFNALSDLFSQLDSTDSNDHNQIISLLDDIRSILVKLEKVN